MARVTYVEIPAGLEENFWKALTAQDRFTFPRITKKVTFFSLQKIAGLTKRSYLPACSQLWQEFSEEQKQAWKEASPKPIKHGWRTFVTDQCIRIKYGIPGTATPSKFHNAWIGNLKISEPASEIKIAQYHPRAYWIQKAVTGKKGMYEPVLITEDFGFPFRIELNYKANLTSVGEGAFAKFYAEIWHSYQGVDYLTPCEVLLDLDTTGQGDNGWKNAFASVSLFGVSTFGDFGFGSESEFLLYYIGYVLYFHLYNVRGDLYIDNLKAEHSEQNWLRDLYCKKINQSFTRAFFQVPKHWVGITLPEGAEFGSTYLE